MPTLSVLATAALAATSKGPAKARDGFPGYVSFPGMSATGFVNIGCFYNGFGAAGGTAKLMCDGNAACQLYDTTKFQSFAKSTVNTYMRVRPSCKNVTGGCAKSPATYQQCAGSGVTQKNVFALPDFLCEQACSRDATCAGFDESGDGGTCTTYKVISSTTSKFSWKYPTTVQSVESEVEQAPPVPVNVQTPSALPTVESFELFTFDLTEPAVNGTGRVDQSVFGRCNSSIASDPAYVSSLMSEDAIASLCAANPVNCQHATSAAAADGFFKVTKLTNPNPTVSTYVNTKVCTPYTAPCGGKFLKCPGLNTLAAPKMVRAYDLSAHIMGEACIEKGCHFFTQTNDNAGGKLYTFAPGSVNSYILLSFS